MKIAVLIKQVPDTWSERHLDQRTGRVDRSDGDQVIDEIDERAIEAALSYRDRASGVSIVTLAMGPGPAADSLRKTLALGADSAVHLRDDALAGADAMATAAVLAAAIAAEQPDLVLCGNVSTDGRGGVVPAMIAERLGLPLLSSLDSLEITESGVSGTRATELGTQRVQAALPAVVSVTERMPEARFPKFKGILSAKRKPLITTGLADLAPASVPARTEILGVAERPARSGGRVLADGDEAVQEVVEFLAGRRLI